MARCTARRLASLTFGEPRSTRETKEYEPPARSATVRMVAGRGAATGHLRIVTFGQNWTTLSQASVTIVERFPLWRSWNGDTRSCTCTFMRTSRCCGALLTVERSIWQDVFTLDRS